MKTLTDAEIEKVRAVVESNYHCKEADKLEALSILSSAHVVDAEPVAWPADLERAIKVRMAEGDALVSEMWSAMNGAEYRGLFSVQQTATVQMTEGDRNSLVCLVEWLQSRANSNWSEKYNYQRMMMDWAADLRKLLDTAAPSNTTTLQIDERAMAVVTAIIDNLRGRKGFDGWFESIDQDVCQELMDDLVETAIASLGGR